MRSDPAPPEDALLAGITHWILSLHGAAAVAIVFAVPALESSAFVGFVFPGEIAVLLGGVLAFQGRPRTGDHAVAGDALVGHAEVGAIMFDEHVIFFEAAGIEQHADPLAGRQPAFSMLRRDALCAAPEPRLRAPRLQFVDRPHHGRASFHGRFGGSIGRAGDAAPHNSGIPANLSQGFGTATPPARSHRNHNIKGIREKCSIVPMCL
jgi:hypothetical protein